MTCNPYNIKVTEGNSFAVILTLKTRTYSADAPIDQDIDPTALADVHVKVNGAEWSAFTVGVEGVSVQFPATQPCGTYNVELTANYNGITIRAAYFECVTIVAWSYQSDAQNYIPDSPLSAKAAYIIAGNYTDAELEALKQQYRDAIEAAEQAEADAEQAKEDYIEKADNLDNLDNVAQQGNDPTATNTAILAAVNNITIDTSTLAQRTDVKDGNDTAISVSKEIRSEVGTGSDTAAETGTLFAVLKWVKDKVKSIFNLIGSPAQGQPSTLFAAIAAGGGGGGSAAVPEISVADTGSAATQELAANTLYIFPNRTSNLTLTLGTPVTGEASEYHFIVEVGSTLPTITLPAGLTWKSSDTIAFDTDTTYEVSILDNYAIFVVW